MTLSGSAERHPARLRSIFRLWLMALAVTAGISGTAATAAAGRTLRYHGYRLSVPSGWPVYRLDRRTPTCVRFNRHALYLGRPSAAQRCPAHAAGRTEAILVSPGARPRAETAAARAAAAAGAGGVAGSGGAVDSVMLGSSGLVATATWSNDRALVSRVLHRPLRATRPSPLTGRVASAGAFAGATARSAQAGYAGLGFDTCSAPSTRSMSAWSQSPFRAVGVYIGGVNSACSQPNLTPSWVADEVQAGWHLIPTYVGYQGAGSCGGSCATINPGQAGAEGTAAATDAITAARALGIPSGSPIYDDMEQYSESSSHTAAVLAFLSAWTTQLHAAGYLSGVYSSASSAITDLVKQQGSGYLEPDEIWVGDWNGQQTTSDPYVPGSDWAAHNRLHQYAGAHNEIYGGVTLNIDSDYVDGATAGTPSTGPAIPNGTFVKVSGSDVVYRIAGGSPLYVSSWTGFGAPQPVSAISAVKFAALLPYPADGTFVQTTTGELYRFAGGAPIAVSSWSVFGAPQPDVVIDQWDIDYAGTSLSHVAHTPADGTVVEGLPSTTYWAFYGGLRTPAAVSATAVAVDDIGLNAFVEGASPTNGTVTGAGTEQPAKPVTHCVVPRLKEMTLPSAATALAKANCRVGKLRESRHVARHHTLHVFGQSATPRSRHSVGYRVNLWLV